MFRKNDIHRYLLSETGAVTKKTGSGTETYKIFWTKTETLIWKKIRTETYKVKKIPVPAYYLVLVYYNILDKLCIKCFL